MSSRLGQKITNSDVGVYKGNKGCREYKIWVESENYK